MDMTFKIAIVLGWLVVGLVCTVAHAWREYRTPDYYMMQERGDWVGVLWSGVTLTVVIGAVLALILS